MTRGVTGGIWGIPLEVDLKDFWGESFGTNELESVVFVAFFDRRVS